MLWDVLMDVLFPNRVSVSMDEEEISRVVARLQREMNQKNAFLDEEIVFVQELQTNQRTETVKRAHLPPISCEHELFSSRSTACGLTPGVRSTAGEFLTYSDHATNGYSSNFMTSNLIAYTQPQEDEGATKEQIDYHRIITEEDLIQQQLLSEQSCEVQNSPLKEEQVQKKEEQVQQKEEQSSEKTKMSVLAKEGEVILMEYLFEYCQEKIEDKDTQSSIDIALHYMSSREQMMHKEDLIRLLIKEKANTQAQNAFQKKDFQINPKVLDIIPNSDHIKILLYQLRLVQAIILIYGHSVDQDLIKLISLFCLIDDKSIKQILEQFGVQSYSSYKKSLHYKYLGKLLVKSAIKSITFATTSHLINNLTNQTKSINLFSSFLSTNKFNDPKVTCKRAEFAFDCLTLDLDSSYD